MSLETVDTRTYKIEILGELEDLAPHMGWGRYFFYYPNSKDKKMVTCFALSYKQACAYRDMIDKDDREMGIFNGNYTDVARLGPLIEGAYQTVAESEEDAIMRLVAKSLDDYSKDSFEEWNTIDLDPPTKRKLVGEYYEYVDQIFGALSDPETRKGDPLPSLTTDSELIRDLYIETTTRYLTERWKEGQGIIITAKPDQAEFDLVN